MNDTKLLLRKRVDELLDERWLLNRQIDALIETIHDQESMITHLSRKCRTARERRLRRIVAELRLRSNHYCQEAYRLRRSRDMWRARAMQTHEERLALRRSA